MNQLGTKTRPKKQRDFCCLDRCLKNGGVEMGTCVCPICCKDNCLVRDDPSGYTYIACKTFGYQFSLGEEVLELPDRDRNKLLNLIFEYLSNTPFYQQGKTRLKWFFFHEPPNKRTDSDPPNCVNISEFPQKYPDSFSHKMNRILLNLHRKWPNMDDVIYIDETCGRLLFCESTNTEDESKNLMTHIISLGFVEGEVALGYYQFTAKGWQHIETLTHQPPAHILEDERALHPIQQLVDELPELEKYLQASHSDFMPTLKTIYQAPIFIEWKSRIVFQLQQLPQNQFIVGILSLLNKFNGWQDEQYFHEVAANLRVLSDNIDKYTVKCERGKDVDKKKVFIVHGHNTDLRNHVELLLRRLELNPIILSNEADKGRTVIEKFENNADVSFAIILYTACDEGRAKGIKDFKDRARQNVLFEHGYFFSKLGKDHVVALVEKEIEFPSDLAGVLYISLDDTEWTSHVKREMKAAGIEADWTKG